MARPTSLIVLMLMVTGVRSYCSNIEGAIATFDVFENLTTCIEIYEVAPGQVFSFYNTTNLDALIDDMLTYDNYTEGTCIPQSSIYVSNSSEGCVLRTTGVDVNFIPSINPNSSEFSCFGKGGFPSVYLMCDEIMIPDPLTSVLKTQNIIAMILSNNERIIPNVYHIDETDLTTDNIQLRLFTILYDGYYYRNTILNAVYNNVTFTSYSFADVDETLDVAIGNGTNCSVDAATISWSECYNNFIVYQFIDGLSQNNASSRCNVIFDKYPCSLIPPDDVIIDTYNYISKGTIKPISPTKHIEEYNAFEYAITGVVVLLIATSLGMCVVVNAD